MAIEGLGLKHRFSMSAAGMDFTMVRSVSFGNELSTIKIPYPDNSKRPHVIGVKSSEISISDAKLKDNKWFSWVMRCVNQGSEKNKKDIFITDEETKNEWTIIGAVPKSDSVSYSRNTDGVVTISMVLSGDVVSNGGGEDTGAGESQITAMLGDVELVIPGHESYSIRSTYTKDSVPGLDGEDGEWISSTGLRCKLPFFILSTENKSANDMFKSLIALAKKDPDGHSPRIVSFVYGDFSIPYVSVKDISFEAVHRDGSGNVILAKGTVNIAERFVDTEKTKPEDKGLGFYEVIGSGETFHSISYKLFNNESLWRALRAWNPLPGESGPCLPQGSIIAVPPYEFVSRYVDEAGVFGWV